MRFFCLLLLILPNLAGCGSERNNAPATRTISDDLGRGVTIPTAVRRVLTLAPSLTELVFAAGAGDKIVGVSPVDDYPHAIDTLPRYNTYPLDFEAIAALEPDLILATDQVNNPGDAETFATLGIPTIFFSYQDLNGMLRSLRTTGDLLGTAERANRAADSLEARISQLAAMTDTLASRPLTLFLVGDETLFAFGGGSYINDLITLAGGRSATADLAAQAPVLDDEFVLTQRPDVILGGFGDDYDPARLLELHPTWTLVPAVQNNRIYSLDPNLVLRPGPRLVEGAYQIAEMLHGLGDHY